MRDNNEKIKTSLRIHQDTFDEIEKAYKDDGSKSKSEFIERAIKFYCGYLATKNVDSYLPEVIDISLKSSIKDLENKISNLMFKNTVELSMLLHAFCATHNVSESNLDKLRDSCVKEVRSLHGILSLKNTLRYQNDR